jgi:hypothetical protein
MASLHAAEVAAVAADAKLAARAAAVRANWRTVRMSCRNALTGPALVGTIAVAGAMLGARRTPVTKPVECKCVKASPSFLRVVALAIFSPLLEDAVARGLKHFGMNRTAEAANDIPVAEPSAPGGTTSPET